MVSCQLYVSEVNVLLTGEFTQENQVRLKHEEEKEQLRLDEWKVQKVEYVSLALRWLFQH